MSTFIEVLRTENHYTATFSTMELRCGFGRRHDISRRPVLGNSEKRFPL